MGRITRQDFAQVPGRIRIEMLDLALQDLCNDVVVATACFHIHLPNGVHQLAKEVARLVLIFRLEGAEWLIAHCSYSIPYQSVQDGEVFPPPKSAGAKQRIAGPGGRAHPGVEESLALYRLLTEDAQDVLWRTDSRLIVTYISPADETLRGFRADEVVGTPSSRCSPTKAWLAQRHAPAPGDRKMRRQFRGFLNFQVEHRCKDGRLIWGEMLSKLDRNAQGEIIGYHGITREITERKHPEEQVRQLAFTTPDPPGQPPPDAGPPGAGHVGQQTQPAPWRPAVPDLDNFSPSTTPMATGAGDLLLIEVAERLKACVREADTVALWRRRVRCVAERTEHATRRGPPNRRSPSRRKVRTRLAEPYVLQSAPSAPSIRPNAPPALAWRSSVA